MALSALQDSLHQRRLLLVQPLARLLLALLSEALQLALLLGRSRLWGAALTASHCGVACACCGQLGPATMKLFGAGAVTPKARCGFTKPESDRLLVVKLC